MGIYFNIEQSLRRPTSFFSPNAGPVQVPRLSILADYIGCTGSVDRGKDSKGVLTFILL